MSDYLFLAPITLMALVAAIVGFYILTQGLISRGLLPAQAGAGLTDPSGLFWAAVVGIAITILIVAITEYFTETRYRPVHLIGGVTDAMTPAEQAMAARAARDAGAIGTSLYKYKLYDTGSWAALSAFDVARP